MKYLDSKVDLTFKKIFGKHKHLTISFWKVLLPINAPIESIVYISREQVLEIVGFTNSIIEVRCKNQRQFRVTTPFFWTNSFKQRLLFNASTARSNS
ncbi:hypothetical protein FLBR109950_03340 [Flavobacterium branchiophilum]|uniref:PD-(D/E)XK nuclease family transposase n=1 Tax=Flavobacterium branchiophilum TaxID=55197 RepID=UPI0002DBA819|nr:PD-(D/E)XK nuclease family transposase [Flavobacterium branchiophilum]